MEGHPSALRNAPSGPGFLYPPDFRGVVGLRVRPRYTSPWPQSSSKR